MQWQCMKTYARTMVHDMYAPSRGPHYEKKGEPSPMLAFFSRSPKYGTPYSLGIVVLWKEVAWKASDSKKAIVSSYQCGVVLPIPQPTGFASVGG